MSFENGMTPRAQNGTHDNDFLHSAVLSAKDLLRFVGKLAALGRTASQRSDFYGHEHGG
jgi:hypothetical protein